MPLLKDKDREYLTEQFKTLPAPVKLIVFTQEFECHYCAETRQIAEELAALSDNITLEVYDFMADQEIAEQYNVDKIPATIIMRGGQQPKDYGIRYYGIPSGYEFSSLIEDIKLVAAGESGLS
ncbi:MAG: thioredoxin family protein, partial [Chloroflexota bacterium]